jgi:hypothetical protein
MLHQDVLSAKYISNLKNITQQTDKQHINPVYSLRHGYDNIHTLDFHLY